MPLINQLPKNVNSEDPQGLKERLLKFLSHFENNFNELVSDTWKL